MKDVDDLAQFIRRVDGNHTMGAGALAEAIVAYQSEAMLADEAVERAARELCAAAGENPDSNELWDEEPPWMDYTDEARAALAAALGEDER